MSPNVIVNTDGFTTFLTADKKEYQVDSNALIEVYQSLVNKEVIA